MSKSKQTDSNGLTLYYFPTSFYSQKVLIGLHEKNVPYHSHILNIAAYEIYHPWYLRMNPKGQVPVLQDGMKIIPDSSRVLEYIDDNFSNGDIPRLFPRKTSDLSNICKQMTDLLSKIDIEVVTFGCVNFPHLTRESKMPEFFQKRYRALGGKRIEILRNLQQENPDLHDIYEDKIADVEQISAKLTNEKEVEKAIVVVDEALNDIEKQLLDIHSKSGEGLHWLLGDQFTVVDIHLGVLLSRIELIGLSHRLYITDNKRPHIQQYLHRIKQRPSFVCHIPKITLYHMLLLPLLKKCAKPLVAIILGGAFAILAGYMFYARRKLA